MSGIIQNHMFSGRSECESRVGDNCQEIERHIPTYADIMRETYSGELYRKTYIYSETEMTEARERLEELAGQAETAAEIKALFIARACIESELKRRNQT